MYKYWFDLLTVVETGSREKVEFYLQEGIDHPDLRTADIIILLFIASENGYADIVELLIQKGAEISIAISENDYHDKITSLLQGGTDTDETIENDPFLDNPFMVAVKKGHKEVVSIFLQYFDCSGIMSSRVYTMNPLFVACMEGHKEIAEILIQSGADVNLSVTDPKAQLHLTNNSAIVIEDLTPIEVSTVYNYRDIVQLLIQNKAYIHLQAGDGSTLLHYAVEHSCKRTAKLLIEKGIDINARDYSGYSALYYATYYTGMYELLLENGATLFPTLDEDDSYLYKYFLLFTECEKPNFSKEAKSRKWDMCQNEVNRMKRYTLGGSTVTMYTFLRQKSKCKLATYISNENIRQEFETKLYTIYFQTYSQIIRGKFHKGMKRLSLLQRAATLMNRFNPKLPDIVIKKISSYLSNSDLRKFNSM